MIPANTSEAGAWPQMLDKTITALDGTKPEAVSMDRAYSFKPVFKANTELGIASVIPGESGRERCPAALSTPLSTTATASLAAATAAELAISRDPGLVGTARTVARALVVSLHQSLDAGLLEAAIDRL